MQVVVLYILRGDSTTAVPLDGLDGLPLMYTLHDSLHQALLKIDVWFRDI